MKEKVMSKKKRSIFIPLSFSHKQESTKPAFWIPVFTGMTLFLLVGLVGSVFAGTYSGGSGEPNDPYLIAISENTAKKAVKSGLGS